MGVGSSHHGRHADQLLFWGSRIVQFQLFFFSVRTSACLDALLPSPETACSEIVLGRRVMVRRITVVVGVG
jgi:hypothetical protein